MSHKRERPALGEALIYPGKADRHLNNPEQTIDQADLRGYRALHLIRSLAIRPELASMLAPLAFGGDL